MGLFDVIRRRRLTQKGLSSGKKRRTQSDGVVVSTLDHSATLRFSIYGAFAFAISVLALNAPEGSGFSVESFERTHAILASLLMAGMAVTAFEWSHRGDARRNGHVLLVFGGLLVHLLVVLLIGLFVARNDAIGPHYALLLIPCALAPMIHSVLLGRSLGIYAVVCVSVFGCLLVPAGYMLGYLATSMLCGVTAVHVMRQLRKRGRLLRAGFYVGAVAVIVSCAFNLIEVRPLFDSGVVDRWAQWEAFGIACLIVFSIGVITGMVVSGLLPILEGIFSLTTDISWLELSDLNHKLLRRMQLEAPGTFHHSLVVASLSEAAAEAVGANAMVCRVCSYFHDIGKLHKPEYFIENQGEENPHDALTPTMSALIIIAHVKDGVDLAIKNKLNPRIIEVIREHHGDSLVYYFYRKAQEQRKAEEDKVEEGLGNPEDLPDIDEKNFRYPGPCPRTRESGIISLADAVESASRSLQKPTVQKIRSLVDEIVFNRLRDGQLDECGLTVRDLRRIRDSFAKTLRSMMHSRIEYPKNKTKTEDDRKSDLHRSEERKRAKRKEASREEKSAPAAAAAEAAGDDAAENVVPVEEVERHRRAANDS